MTRTIFPSRYWLLLLAGALAAPVSLRGQQDTSATRTYVVKKGDTLWRIAQETLGDGARWREILTLNRRTLPSASRLSTGMRLVLPAATGKRAPAAAPTARTPAAPAARGDTIVAPRGARVAAGRSLFAPGGAGRGLDSLGGRAKDSLPPPPAVRRWEYVAAPFVASDVSLRNAGRCVSLENARGTATGAAPGVRYGEHMAMRPPDGPPAAAGQRFLVARSGGELGELGSIVVPTGVVRIAEAPAGGAPASAEIIAQFGTLSCNDLILPLELPTDTIAAHPTPVPNGATGEIVWIAGASLLPSLEHAIIVNIGANAGLRPGDQVSLLAPPRPDSSVAGTAVVAIASVIRVGPRTATANIIQQVGADVRLGTPVRVSAKLP